MSDGPLPGPVLIGLEGWELKPRERDWLQNPQVGGVVLFSRNYHTLAQLELLNESIRRVTVGENYEKLCHFIDSVLGLNNPRRAEKD